MELAQEFTIKRKRVTEFLAATGLRGLLLRRHDNFAWLTCGGNANVTVVSDVGVGALLVMHDGGEYLITNNIEAGRLLEEEGLGALGFTPLTHPWDRDDDGELAASVAGDLSQIGCDTPFAGCPCVQSGFLPYRRALTPNERERYSFLGLCLSRAVESAMFRIRPGMREGDVAGQIAEELWKERIDVTNFLVAFDDRIGKYRHPVTVNRILDKTAMLSVNARYKGLVATITRLGHLGKIPEELARQYYSNVAIECRMIAATRPGVCESVPLRVAAESYAEFGYSGEEKLHHQGGGMGYQSRDTIATPKSTATVGTDEAYCWNPTIKGTKSEDGFIVEPSGFSFITRPVCFPAMTLEADGVAFVRPALLEI